MHSTFKKIIILLQLSLSCSETVFKISVYVKCIFIITNCINNIINNYNNNNDNSMQINTWQSNQLCLSQLNSIILVFICILFVVTRINKASISNKEK